jgi:hypothetical protein
MPRKSDFRVAPESGLRANITPLPFGARYGSGSSCRMTSKNGRLGEETTAHSGQNRLVALCCLAATTCSDGLRQLDRIVGQRIFFGFCKFGFRSFEAPTGKRSMFGLWVRDDIIASYRNRKCRLPDWHSKAVIPDRAQTVAPACDFQSFRPGKQHLRNYQAWFALTDSKEIQIVQKSPRPIPARRPAANKTRQQTLHP